MAIAFCFTGKTSISLLSLVVETRLLGRHGYGGKVMLVGLNTIICIPSEGF